jgi:hypothetical protein
MEGASKGVVVTFLVTMLVYYCIYQAVYAGIPAIIILTMFRYVPESGPVHDVARVLAVGLAGVVLVGLYVAGRRAYLSAQAYGERNMGLWEAHFSSGPVLQAELTFLPIIGRFFEKRDE